MFPSFGCQYSPGDLLSAKTFQRVASLDIETTSDDCVKTRVCYRNVDSSKLLMTLCDMLDCNYGHQMVNSVINAEERFELILNFLYSQPNRFPCFGFHVVRKENESCFEISNFKNSAADLMVSKTLVGTFFLCVMTSKFPIIDSVMQKFDFVLKELPGMKEEHCKYFDDQNITFTVFANWTEMICNQVSAGVALEKLFLYSREKNNHQVVAFDVDDFTECLPVLPLPIDPNFETCYRLMRSIKNKGAELRKIYDSKKKRNEKSTVDHFKYLLANLEKELKQTYFLKFEHIYQLNGIFIDAMEFLDSELKRFLSNGIAFDISLYQMMESCLTMFLTKFNNGKCTIQNNTIFYNADKPEDLVKLFDKNAFIALKSHTVNFKEWISLKFLQHYPLCYIKNYPSIPDLFVLYDDNAIYGFGTLSVKRSYQKQKHKFDNFVFSCVNPEHKYDRFWKCSTCKEYATSNDRKEICCKCGINYYDNVDFRCSFSGGKICTKKMVATSRQKHNASKDVVESNDDKAYNIVLFGPVGSGKSTLINAAMNYLEYPTYEKATSRESIAPIPFNFSLFDDGFEEKIIKSQEIPGDSPENFASSVCTTQRPKVYERYSNGKTYRFVDTVCFTGKDFPSLNLDFWRKLKRIDAIWITISATQNLGDIDSWIRIILKVIPKKIYSCVHFVFTNIQGKHALLFNSNFATVAKFFSNHKEIPFGNKNVFAVENNCLRSLYAQRAGCSLSVFQNSLNNTWNESRLVILDLLGKASASKSHVEDVFFLNNLFYIYLRLKRLCNAEQLACCYDLLTHNFMTMSSKIKDKPPSYGDVMKSLQSIESEILHDSAQHKLLIEFIDTFGDHIKDQNSGVFGSVKNFVSSIFHY